jgi:hypothetical protein
MAVRHSRILFVASAAVALVVLGALAPPADAARTTETAALNDLAARVRARLDAQQGDLFRRLRARRDGPQGLLNADERLGLSFIDERGVPRFFLTHNLNAAGTVGTNRVWPGGSTGLNLTGSSTLLGELGEWDGAGVRTLHQEFDGRVTQMDTPAGFSSHSTHVAGTMVAQGQNGAAKGMSFEGRLAAYEWTDDTIEMAAAATGGMLVSNHSYGFAAGWLFNFDGSGRWFWFGDTTVSAVEDYGFGYYDQVAADWDQLAYDAPFYSIVKSAGNDRNDPGPAQPALHYVWDPTIEDWVPSMTVRDADGSPLGYDTIAWFGTAKNIITVGAVNDILGGWTQPSDVSLASFSAWGPTDDGRIKPDLVANGVNLFSCIATGLTSYGNTSGTSMSTPNLSGSLNLLVQHYEAEHGGQTPRSATMKAVMIQSASEAGPSPGPDYEAGWGLLNVPGAAAVITADDADIIQERTLADGAADAFTLVHPGGDLRVTIAWTDPPGTPAAPALDPSNPMLVNDLDLRVVLLSPVTEYLPWVLDPANPQQAATTGINSVDNVEQVFAAGAPAGTYTVVVRHKGTLVSGSQDYSIVGSGELPPGGVVGVPQPEGVIDFLGAYPNPFSQGTSIRFVLAAPADVELAVFDLHGRRLHVIERGPRGAGVHVVPWNGRDDRNARLTAGVYFLRIEAAGKNRVERLVLVD